MPRLVQDQVFASITTNQNVKMVISVSFFMFVNITFKVTANLERTNVGGE